MQLVSIIKVFQHTTSDKLCKLLQGKKSHAPGQAVHKSSPLRLHFSAEQARPPQPVQQQGWAPWPHKMQDEPVDSSNICQLDCPFGDLFYQEGIIGLC